MANELQWIIRNVAGLDASDRIPAVLRPALEEAKTAILRLRDMIEIRF